jgi:cystathionine beta-lyase
LNADRSEFDAPHDRRASGCNKWNRYDADVLPLWVADMDFAVPEPVCAALRTRLDHPVLGYGMAQAGVRGAIVAWLRTQYGWAVEEEAIVFVPGVVPGFNLALRAACPPGAGVVVQPPVYPPMLRAPANWDLRRLDAPLAADGAMDIAALRGALAEAGQGAFLLCNPHNPTGRAFTRDELAAAAQACLDAGVTIVSDEIHCDLLLDGRRHLPIATLSPEIAARTITLMSAGKTFNIAGLNACWAVITDPALRARFQRAASGVADHVNILGLAATEASLTQCAGWRLRVLDYLQANRDWLAAAVAARLPGVSMQAPEATYLAWLDCRASAASADPYGFFLERARVAFSPGPDFGTQGQGFVRLNFGCTRATLEEAVRRMEVALASA